VTSKIRALREQAERDEHEASDALARVRRDYKDGKLSADDWAEFREELTAELEAASANVARLRKQEQEAAKATSIRDAEEETFRRLGELRREIAGRVKRSRGTRRHPRGAGSTLRFLLAPSQYV
jgi:anti-sigma factor RsiW